MKKKKGLGKIRVAKYFYKTRTLPTTDGYTNVLIHTKGPLSPYQLKNEDGHLLENIWQFCKLYPRVTAQRTSLSQWQPQTVIWEHGAEVHVDANGTPTEAYWQWREKGLNNPYAVRYPNGYKGRKDALCHIWNGDRLTYVEARKAIYIGEYARLAPLTDEFKRLKKLLENGTNLQIIEVDGPNPSLTYPPYDQISDKDPGLLMTQETLSMLLNDIRHPFGHGYTIAGLLLDLEFS